MDLYNQGIITFENIQKLIIDEVDQMLELGFLHDVNTIIAPIPTSAQRVFVSATLPEAIEKMAKKQLRDMTYIQISETQKKITEYLLFVDKADKKRSNTVSSNTLWDRTSHCFYPNDTWRRSYRKASDGERSTDRRFVWRQNTSYARVYRTGFPR